MTRTKILETAHRIVCGEREGQYGSPEDSFKTIAQFWTTYVQARCAAPNSKVDIGAVDVAAMMALLKIARITSCEAHEDNWIDIAGYAACGGELETGNG